ncbi:MAG: molybdopterin-dependent oxidoreductase, partial [Acidobacteriaceae bacterium]
QGRATMGVLPGEYDLRIVAPGYSAVQQKMDVHLGFQVVTVAMTHGTGTLSEPPVCPGKADAQNIASLVITASPGQRGVYTLATLKDLPHQTVTIFDHHTKANETYSGVPLMDLLAKLGVPHGEALHGKALTDYVVATGSDGYKSVVALAEIDPEFHPGMVLVADAMDGKPLGATGPFRLIVSEDKRPARSVRNLVSIELKAVE